jgi:chromosome segregation ATPase
MPGTWLSIAAVLAIGTIQGCATKSDLESLKQELQASVAATKGEVSQKVSPLADQVEKLKSETKAGLEATRKQLEERERQLAQDLKTQQEALAKLTDSIKDMQAKLNESLANDQTLFKESKELRTGLQSTKQVVLDFLKAEAAQLKDRLKWMLSALKEMGGPEEPVKP